MERGQTAVRELESEGLNPEFVQLDVSNSESIESAQKWVKEKYGRLDILINNAGILLKVSDRVILLINLSFFFFLVRMIFHFLNELDKLLLLIIMVC